MGAAAAANHTGSALGLAPPRRLLTPEPSHSPTPSLTSSPSPAQALRSPAGVHTTKPAAAGRLEPLLLITAVLAVHAAVVAGWQSKPDPSKPTPSQQIIELLRPHAPEPVEPPPPPPPPPPPKLQRAEPPPTAPTPAPAPAALRTPAAEPDVPPTALTVPENTQAPRSSGPVVAAAPAPAPAPPAPAPVPAPAAVEEPVVEANAYAAYLKNPPPQYPAVALRQGWQGRVVLRVRVLADGRAEQVELRTSSGRRVLDEAAIEAVRGWAFAPAKRGSTAIDAWATVPVEFKLAN